MHASEMLLNASFLLDMLVHKVKLVYDLSMHVCVSDLHRTWEVSEINQSYGLLLI